MARQFKIAFSVGASLLALAIFGSTASRAAESNTVDVAPALLCASQMDSRWSAEIRSFERSASAVTESFASLSDAMAFARRETAMSQRNVTRVSLSRHGEHALAIANLAGRERTVSYVNEILAISDAMLGITKLSELAPLQNRWRASVALRLEILAEADRQMRICPTAASSTGGVER